MNVAIDDSPEDNMSHPALQSVSVDAKLDKGRMRRLQKRSHNHATHVSGIVAMAPDIGEKIVGVNSFTNNNIKIYPRVVWRNGDGHRMEAISHNKKNNIRISTNSWGSKDMVSSESTYTEFFEQLKVADHLFVTGAENNVEDMDRNPMFPCRNKYESVLCVGMLDQEGNIASGYSEKEVDLFAPGYHIMSTLPNGRYAPMSGTSMAGPIVAGAAAMLLSLRPTLTTQELKKILTETVDKDDRLKGKSASGGRLNAHNAVLKVIELNLAEIPLPNPLPNPPGKPIYQTPLPNPNPYGKPPCKPELPAGGSFQTSINGFLRFLLLLN